MNKPEQLGRYILIDKIASGGMADVFRAKLCGVEGFEKDFAIKRILPYWSHNREFVEMLIDEAKVLLHLNHANIVQVNELNRDYDIYYIVMEFVDGIDLRHLLKHISEKGKVIPLEIALFIALQICNGLQYAHEKRDKNLNLSLELVHRDISPQNILLSFEGEVKVTDFGIAKAIGRTTETQTGVLKGKFSYMSPEQALGQDVDSKTDIFAVGILMYEMATGDKCFKGQNDMATLEAVRQARVEFDEKKKDRIPAGLRNIILKCLQKDKNDRYPSMASLKSDLRALERSLGFETHPENLKEYLSEALADYIKKKKENFDNVNQKTLAFQATQGQSKTIVANSNVATMVSNEQATTFYQSLSSERLDPTVLDVTILKKSAPSQKSSNKLGPLLLYSTALIITLATIFLVINLTFLKTEVRPQPKAPLFTNTTPPPPMPGPVQPEAAPVVAPVVEPVAVKQPETPTKILEEKTFGSIQVKASPWGYVTINGVVSGLETPFTKKIATGKQTVKIFFPPSKKTLTTTANITENHLTFCVAVFADKSKFSCK